MENFDPLQAREQLQKILSSSPFQRTFRSSQLLQYLVETTLADPGKELKEFTIATEVFDRPDSFDPRVDSLVRVEAMRLRTRLERYYATAGENDPVEIKLPVGSYVPVFQDRTVPAAPAMASPPSAAPPLRRWTPRSRRIAAALAVGLTATVVLATRLILSEPALHVRTTQRITVPGGVALSPVLSPDGKTIFYASNTGDTRLRIWRQPLRGGPAQPMTSPDWDTTELDLSPNGSLLAYRSMRSGGGIYIQPATGGPELLIANLGRSPRFSADNKRVLFWAQEPHTHFGKVYWTLLSGHDESMPVAAEFADAHNPQWTPDGRVIFCGTLHPDVKSKEHDFWVVSARTDAPPIKTGLVDLLAAHGIALHPRSLNTTSFQWYGNNLIFPAVHRGQTSLYIVAMKPGEWIPVGEPRLLDRDGNARESPNLRGERIAAISADSNLNIYRIPLAPDGSAAGPPVPLTHQPGNEFAPSLSADGHYLVYLAKHDAQGRIWKRDLLTGMETELYRGNFANRLKLSPDGAKAFFRVFAGPPPQRQEIHEVDLVTGRLRTVCDNCGIPTSVSFTGDRILYETGTRLPRAALLDVASQEKPEVLRHPHHGVTGARFSPDGKWLAFELDRGLDGKQLFVAPFRGGAQVPEADWIPVSDARFSSFEPAWSPNGRILYFLSDRNGSGDLWMQRLHSTTNSVEGPAVLVYPFQNARLTPQYVQTWESSYAGLSIGPGNAVLALSELASDIWLGNIQP